MRRHGNERGAVLVEFALILPILVMFVFGIIQFGQAYNARIELTSAVREGARAAALGADPVAATMAAAPGLNPRLKASDITYTASPGSACTGASSTTTTTSASTTTTTIPTATVTASYPFAYQIPLVRSGTVTLSATGVFRCGA